MPAARMPGRGMPAARGWGWSLRRGGEGWGFDGWCHKAPFPLTEGRAPAFAWKWAPHPRSPERGPDCHLLSLPGTGVGPSGPERAPGDGAWPGALRSLLPGAPALRCILLLLLLTAAPVRRCARAPAALQCPPPPGPPPRSRSQQDGGKGGKGRREWQPLRGQWGPGACPLGLSPLTASQAAWGHSQELCPMWSCRGPLACMPPSQA